MGALYITGTDEGMWAKRLLVLVRSHFSKLIASSLSQFSGERTFLLCMKVGDVVAHFPRGLMISGTSCYIVCNLQNLLPPFLLKYQLKGVLPSTFIYLVFFLKHRQKTKQNKNEEPQTSSMKLHYNLIL